MAVRFRGGGDEGRLEDLSGHFVDQNQCHGWVDHTDCVEGGVELGGHRRSQVEVKGLTVKHREEGRGEGRGLEV